jgi:N-acylneuraminate cytidylyltransferase
LNPALCAATQFGGQEKSNETYAGGCMSYNDEVIAVVPVKGQSERVKNKNLRLLNGESLLARKIRTLQQCRGVSRIIVNSDSDEMLAVGKHFGVETVKREPYFAVGTTPMNDVIHHEMENSPDGHIYWAQVTSPLLTPETVDRAISVYFAKLQERYDSLASVQRLLLYLWKDEKPINYTLDRHPNSQSLDPYFCMTFGILLIQKELALRRRYYIGERPYLFEVNPIEASDIDTEYDLQFAELYLRTQIEKPAGQKSA